MTFEEYVLARGAALVRFARLLTGDEHRADDLTQDVLARAYAGWSKVARSDQPDLYVRRMLVNANHSWWRRRSNQEISTAELADRRKAPDTADELVERDALWRLVQALPPRQRTAVVLRYYEDYDDATIAEIMRCSVGTVRTHAKRALEKLQAGLPGPAPVTTRRSH